MKKSDVTYAEAAAIDPSCRSLYWGFYFDVQQYYDCTLTAFANLGKSVLLKIKSQRQLSIRLPIDRYRFVLPP
jgi:hypothetical protein